jgi:hypothetical protein
MFIYLHQNLYSVRILISNKTFENVPKLRFLGRTAENQSYIHEDKPQRMLQFRIFCLPVSCPRKLEIKY